MTFSGAAEGTAEISCDGTTHASMAFSLAPLPPQTPPEPLLAATEEERLRKVARPYEVFGEQGFSYGPAFALLEGVEVLLGGEAASRLRSSRRLCPGVIDAAMQLATFARGGVMGIPARIASFAWWPGDGAVSAARASAASEEGHAVQMVDASGAAVASVHGLQLVSFTPPTRLAFKTLDQARATSDGSKGPPASLVITVAADGGSPLPHLRRVTEAATKAAVAVHVPDDAPWRAVVQSHAWDLGIPVVDAAGLPLAEPSLRSLPPPPPTALTPPDKPYVVRVVAGGAVRFEQRPAAHGLAAGEVELRADIWALNFRDVLLAKGAMSDVVAGKALGLGGECVGVVTRVGEGVRHVIVGERVVAAPPAGMGSYLTTDGRWVWRAPKDASDEEAVSGSVAYATAWLALHWQARIRSGDAVLVHSAAGGVGLAAVHLCLAAGCTVYATASTDAKHQHLLALGVAAVFTSRRPSAFSTGVRAATGGDGVDVVLNSLAGEESVRASLSLLRPFGQFCELGKRDAYADAPLRQGAFLAGLSYHASHLDVLMLKHPQRGERLFEEVRASCTDLPDHVGFHYSPDLSSISPPPPPPGACRAALAAWPAIHDVSDGAAECGARLHEPGLAHWQGAGRCLGRARHCTAAAGNWASRRCSAALAGCLGRRVGPGVPRGPSTRRLRGGDVTDQHGGGESGGDAQSSGGRDGARRRRSAAAGD